jgi:hypothetical protein
MEACRWSLLEIAEAIFPAGETTTRIGRDSGLPRAKAVSLARVVCEEAALALHWARYSACKNNKTISADYYSATRVEKYASRRESEQVILFRKVPDEFLATRRASYTICIN